MTLYKHTSLSPMQKWVSVDWPGLLSEQALGHVYIVWAYNIDMEGTHMDTCAVSAWKNTNNTYTYTHSHKPHSLMNISLCWTSLVIDWGL